MFGLGTGEFLLILLVAFLVFGPDRLPELMFRLGRTVREIQKNYQDVVESFQNDLYGREVLDNEEKHPDARGDVSVSSDGVSNKARNGDAAISDRSHGG
ncbi:MAG: Sec-independent protein translocase subunit TatA/TatB [bacterium JZ-2024 1]